MSEPKKDWPEPVVFEAWGTVEDGAHTICAPEAALDMKKSGLLETEDTALFSIRGSSWTEVMTNYHEIQGWKPYVPMEGD